MPATQTPPRLISIGRIASRKIKNGNSDILETVITYVPGADGSKTALVASYQNGSDAAYSYTYDANGNITGITQGSMSFTYEYDKANQLVRENLYYGSGNSNNATYTYEYDAWGNILNKKKYAYTTGTLGSVLNTKTYGYTNTQWGDLLTSYNGSTITYDAMGNMASYGSKTYSWEGKQLVGISLLGAANYTFSYDENGLRTSKTLTWVSDNTSVATEYYYNGSVLIGMKTGSTVMRFSYDASGNVVSVDYSTNNGSTFTTYYYLRNAQSDIVKIIDGSGNTVVEYTYDSWGKPVSTTGSLSDTLGEDQPFRYRGYVYDEETDLYYLQSRYYDPKIGRFISADVYLSTGQGVLGHNSFAYCLNNPTTLSDNNGKTAAPAITAGLLAKILEAIKIFFLVVAGAIIVVAIAVGIGFFIKYVSETYTFDPKPKVVSTAQKLKEQFKKLLKQLVKLIAAAAAAGLAAKKLLNNSHQHHIIAKRALRAAVARLVYVLSCKKDINDPANIASVKAYIHVHLHTTAYYATINALISGAYTANGVDGVDSMLRIIKGILESYR